MRADALVIDPGDDVAVALRDLPAGPVRLSDGSTVVLAVPVPLGHKLARRPIAPGATVKKYGAPIGAASEAIAPGQHVHVHNLKSRRARRETMP